MIHFVSILKKMVLVSIKLTIIDDKECFITDFFCVSILRIRSETPNGI